MLGFYLPYFCIIKMMLHLPSYFWIILMAVASNQDDISFFERHTWLFWMALFDQEIVAFFRISVGRARTCLHILQDIFCLLNRGIVPEVKITLSLSWTAIFAIIGPLGLDPDFILRSPRPWSICRARPVRTRIKKSSVHSLEGISGYVHYPLMAINVLLFVNSTNLLLVHGSLISPEGLASSSRPCRKLHCHARATRL